MSLLPADEFKTYSTVCGWPDPPPALLLSKQSDLFRWTSQKFRVKNFVKNKTLLRIGSADYTLLAVEMFWISEVQMLDLLELDAL